jgi:hypothetical protein
LHDLEMKYADVISLEDAVGLFEGRVPAAHDQGDARS